LRKFADTEFESEKGRKWRDETLVCLQQSLVPYTSGQETCESLTRIAFDSHPRCYTQPGASICELTRPSIEEGITSRAQDIVTISTTVDGSDLLTTRSAEQIGSVMKECLGQIGDYAWDKTTDVAREAYDWITSW
jgi:hypothetical protein